MTLLEEKLLQIENNRNQFVELGEESAVLSPVGALALGVVVSVPLFTNVAGAGERQIQNGDTMTEISEEEGVPVKAIMDANPKITNPNKIYAGDTIVIPEGQPETDHKEHTVLPYENYWTIAREHLGLDASLADVSEFTKELVALNENGKGTLLHPGDVIKIPVQKIETGTNVLAKLPETFIPQKGDTLGKFAARHKVTVAQAQSAYGIKDQHRIYAGTEYTNSFYDPNDQKSVNPSDTTAGLAEKLPDIIPILPGDSVSAIANRLKVSPDEIGQIYQGAEDIDRIIAGTSLDNKYKTDGSMYQREQASPSVDNPPEVAPQGEAFDPGVTSDKVLREWNVPVGEGTAFPNQDSLDSFISKVEQISDELGFPPDYLMAVMKFETGGSFNPAQRNLAGSSATGLIQFMATTARNLGTTTDALAAMSPNEQLDYVYNYFVSSKDQLHDLYSVYLKVFYPAAIGKHADYVLPLSSLGYRQNKGFDANKDGKITVAEISARVREVYSAAPMKPTEPVIVDNILPVTEPNIAEAEGNSSNTEVVPPVSSDESTQPEVTPLTPSVPEPTPEEPKPEVVETHPYIDISTKTINSEGVETVKLKDAQGNTYGDEVAYEIAGDLAKMFEAAENAGIRFHVLSGARTTEEQIELRKQHGCGGSLVYDRSCKGNPPTAVPGHSNHNKGLAVDLRVGINGETRVTIGSTAYNWLMAHSQEFGFKNLESEPWHYSVDGK